MSAITAIAEGQPCMAYTPLCNGDPRTTVWCHLNDLALGRGASFKTPDIMGFFGCSGCHDYVDGRRGGATFEEKRSYAHLACLRTVAHLWNIGYLRFRKAA